MIASQAVIGSVGDLGYGPIVVVIAVAMLMGGAILAITHALPKAARRGAAKDAPYESGMPLIGDARRRFNVRFYLVAMLFLLFDVELVFMYPWALVFTDAARSGGQAVQTTFLFWEMAIFFAILLVGFAYAWGKGIFRWD